MSVTKRVISSAFAVAFASLCAIASPTTLPEAETQAVAFVESKISASTRGANSGSTAMDLIYTRDNAGTPLFYVFNYSDGYVITSADDKFPAILGYSDSGQFDPDNLPENMKTWLNGYAEEMIHYLPILPDGFGRIMHSLKAKRSPIAPLVTTKWNQDSPYNLLCPMDNYGRSVTGCVATAYAQIMNYHKWPAQPVGSSGDVDFNGTTYNWRQMLDEYVDGNYTGPQATAVATLMRQCGAAVNMRYSSWSSGAYSTSVQVAMPRYFKYMPDLECLWKDYIPMTEWTNTIYGELAAGRPVYYSGSSSEGGHAFVCDGYSDNEYFHFNWGWGGYEDGYFLLSALNPASGGIGAFEDGYTSNQMVIINIRPGEGSAEPTQVHLMCSGGFYHSQGTTFNVQKGNNNENLFYNPLGYAINVQPGIKIAKADGSGTPVYRECGSATKLQSFYGFINMTVGSMPKLEDGIYHITPAYRALDISNDWRDMPVPIGKQNFVELTVTNGTMRYANLGPDADSTPKLLFGEPETMSVIYGNTPITVKVPVVNVGKGDFSDYLGCTIMDVESEFGGSESVMNKYTIPAGSSMNIELTFYEELPAGNYVFSILDTDGENTYLDNYKMKIEEAEYEAVDSSISAYDLAPNFFTSGVESPLYFSIENLSASSERFALRFELLDSTTLEKIKELPINGISIPGSASGRFSVRPFDLEVEPGEYYWRITDSQGKPISTPSPMMVNSEVRTSNGICYVITSEAKKEAVIVAPEEEPYSGVINIPDVIDGYSVKAIRNNAFTFATTTQVTIPERIHLLSQGTFYDNTTLRNLIINSDEIIPYQENIFNNSRLSNIWLNVSQDLIQEWHSQQGWSSMMTPYWLVTLDDVEIAEGMDINPATGNPFAPYRMNFATPLQVKFKAPAGKNVEIILIRNGEWLMQGVVDPTSYILDMPALGLSGTGELRAKATTDVVGVAGVETEGHFDIYSIDGRLIKSGADKAYLKTLPKGIYIANGKKILVK